MKKIMAIFLCAVMVCSLMPTAFAGEDASEGARDDGYIFEPEPNLTHEEIVEKLKNDPTTETCSEYDAILQEKAEATKVLASKSASASEKIGAKLVEQFDPTAEVYKLQEKTDKELHEMGYSADRIQMIRNFRGTDAEMQALSANCSVSGYPTYTKNASGQWAKITLAFSWDKAPIWKKRDAAVAQASTGFLTDTVPDTKCNINYKDPFGNVSYEYFDASDLKYKAFNTGNPAGFSFNVMKKCMPGMSEATCFAQSGMATIVFRSKDTHQVQLSYGYAHARKDISADVGISFSSVKPTGSLGFLVSNEYYNMLPNGGRTCPSHFF